MAMTNMNAPSSGPNCSTLPSHNTTTQWVIKLTNSLLARPWNTAKSDSSTSGWVKGDFGSQ
ncbi:uncharacterized protein N7525_008223 [Penicillium rubens]|uniref:uncharacterized protein n=1 Tax=Penicillium rubens TaxID=1108849 RepID=UPI002A5A2E59|nr:uncharacterized protein N7525_008223 [Penicillium rubens]KAJ5829970.1 hypothetical protein N7525_008223 [Penicillium rubens]KAJ5853554.1 hypothetical protein N7534_006097 [Penicillium rubens]